MKRDFFCDKCSLQFDKMYVFDLHLSLVHGEEIKVKSELQICEEESEKKHMKKFALILRLTQVLSETYAVLFSKTKET